MANLIINAVKPQADSLVRVVQAAEAISLVGAALYVSEQPLSGPPRVSLADASNANKADCSFIGLAAAGLDEYLLAYFSGSLELSLDAGTPLPQGENILLSTTPGRLWLPADFAAAPAGTINRTIGNSQTPAILDLVFSTDGNVK